MKVSDFNFIYENPIPQLKSRQSMFPCLFKLPSGRLGAVHVIGEAFESADQVCYVSFSDDGGKTWSAPKEMYDKINLKKPFSNSSKAVCLPDGRLISVGYGFYRGDSEKPIGNPETGGLLDDIVFYSISEDEGETWSAPCEIKCAWGPHVEASAPLIHLQSGALATPITGFPDWDGNMTAPHCGRLLRSDDGGKTWSDDVVCMEFKDKKVTCYEQRICQTDSGAIVCIGWNEDVETGERLHNHYTYSLDDGKTWSDPESTGVMGQASFVCAMGGEKILAIHSVRRDTDRPGIYGYIIDFSERKWKVIDECVLWEPDFQIKRDKSMAEIFAFLKFGQPSAIMLNDGEALMTFWYAEQGQYKTVAAKIEL